MPVATTTPADRTGTDRTISKRRPSDSERDLHRAEHLQQIPQDTRAHQLLYPYRSDAVSLHNQLDQSLWNRRMISYGLARQEVYVLGFALSQNAPATTSTGTAGDKKSRQRGLRPAPDTPPGESGQRKIPVGGQISSFSADS
ncbi:hypothetical protein [Streptomyces sp. NPDC047985]|uniref:hypothetical protein n=1 Tax=Streptomyces sp. NPDC047985 TaxID=3155384 RepID=UPI00341BBBB9